MYVILNFILFQKVKKCEKYGLISLQMAILLEAMGIYGILTIGHGIFMLKLTFVLKLVEMAQD